MTLERAAELLDLIAKRRVELDSEDADPPGDLAQQPHERAVAAERTQAILRELRQLPANQREAVIFEAFGIPAPSPAAAAAGRRGLARLSLSPRLRQLRS